MVSQVAVARQQTQYYEDQQSFMEAVLNKLDELTAANARLEAKLDELTAAKIASVKEQPIAIKPEPIDPSTAVAYGPSTAMHPKAEAHKKP